MPAHLGECPATGAGTAALARGADAFDGCAGGDQAPDSFVQAAGRLSDAMDGAVDVGVVGQVDGAKVDGAEIGVAEIDPCGHGRALSDRVKPHASPSRGRGGGHLDRA